MGTIQGPAVMRFDFSYRKVCYLGHDEPTILLTNDANSTARIPVVERPAPPIAPIVFKNVRLIPSRNKIARMAWVQRVVFRPSRSAISGYGPRSYGTRTLRASVFQPVHRGCSRSVRRAVLVQFTGEGDSARTLSRDGAAGEEGAFRARVSTFARLTVAPKIKFAVIIQPQYFRLSAHFRHP
jgi:hypothetical protein